MKHIEKKQYKNILETNIKGFFLLRFIDSNK